MIVHKTKIAIEADVADAEQIRRIMEVSSTICAVRQGSRLTRRCKSFYRITNATHSLHTEDHVSSLLTLYTQVEYQATLHTTLLRSTVAVLQASQLQLWSGVGRRLIEHAWKSSAKLGIETLGCLAEMDWKGWSMIGAPLLLRHTPDGLEQQPNLMVHLLSRLYKAKKLGEVDHVWKQRMDKWVGLELTGWQRSEDKVSLLREHIRQRYSSSP
jgi:U3 small nucleolar RNA-associated protein 20